MYPPFFSETKRTMFDCNHVSTSSDFVDSDKYMSTRYPSKEVTNCGSKISSAAPTKSTKSTFVSQSGTETLPV